MTPGTCLRHMLVIKRPTKHMSVTGHFSDVLSPEDIHKRVMAFGVDGNLRLQ